MATPKTKPEPSRQRINAGIHADLWRRFRAALVLNYLSVSEGLEQAIEVWLAHENSE